MTIRTATALDIDAVMTVIDEAFDPRFGEAWSRAQCLGILGLPDVWLLIDEAAGSAAGIALSRRVIDEAELLLLAVRPAMRRQGTGRALVDAVAEGARVRGATRLMLEMRDGNAAAGLYAAAGFAPIGRRRGYYRGTDGTVRDAITLSCDIALPRSAAPTGTGA